MYMIACAVISPKYITSNKEGFRIPAIVLTIILFLIALIPTYLGFKNVYNSQMKFRKIKKYINARWEE